MECGHGRGWINAQGRINVLIKQSSHSPAPQPNQIIVTEEEDADVDGGDLGWWWRGIWLD